jgi:phage shock protein A
VNDQLPDIRERSWLLQSMMEMQKTQGQLVEAVQSLREGQKDLQTQVGTVAQAVGSLSQRVGTLEQKVHAAQTVMWVVGMGLAGTVGLVGWLITNAITVLPALLNPR